MTPLAAYDVMVVTENERKNAVHSYVSHPIRPSLSSRIAKALGARAARSTRTVSAQPA